MIKLYILHFNPTFLLDSGNRETQTLRPYYCGGYRHAADQQCSWGSYCEEVHLWWKVCQLSCLNCSPLKPCCAIMANEEVNVRVISVPWFADSWCTDTQSCSTMPRLMA